MELPTETRYSLITRLQGLLDMCSNMKHRSMESNVSEAQWYEPWCTLLLWLVLEQPSAVDVTVAPQSRLTILISPDDHWAVINPTDLQNITQQRYLKRSRIPDFVCFKADANGSRRAIPLIVEIKPFAYQTPSDVKEPELLIKAIQNMLSQTLVQARFAHHRIFTKKIYVLCVVGKHWFSYSLSRDEFNRLPPMDFRKDDDKGYEEKPAKNHKLRKITGDAKALDLLNPKEGRFTQEFHDFWTGVTTAWGLPSVNLA